MTDAELLASFETGTLEAESFGHREHVRLAWLQVTRLPLLEAMRVQTEGLRRLVSRLGMPGKYHATLTIGWLLLVHERATAPDAPRTWRDFAAANPDLLTSSSDVLRSHYSPERLASVEARHHFVPPDRLQ